LGGAGSIALELLQQLPSDQRTAIQGRVLQERDYADLAQSLSCSQSVVRQRVSRGLKEIRRRLEHSP
jgi:RNA polymerase sigma-70 factor (ECF subfamily)